MALKHGTIEDGDLGITGVLIHEKRRVIEDVSIESMASDGAFGAGQGKSIRKRGSVTVSGDMLDTAALPEVGTGGATAETDPHVDRAEDREQNEGAAEFTVEGHWFEAGEGDYPAS